MSKVDKIRNNLKCYGATFSSENSYDDLLELLVKVFEEDDIDIMKYVKLPKEVKYRIKRDNNINDILD